MHRHASVLSPFGFCCLLSSWWLWLLMLEQILEQTVSCCCGADRQRSQTQNETEIRSKRRSWVRCGCTRQIQQWQTSEMSSLAMSIVIRRNTSQMMKLWECLCSDVSSPPGYDALEKVPKFFLCIRFPHRIKLYVCFCFYVGVNNRAAV